MASPHSTTDHMQDHSSASASRWVVTVPGMHRSGTSVATKLLSLLGGTLPARLMAANSNNPEGYFEPSEIVAIHDRVLDSVGSSWLDWRPLPIQWFRSDAVTRFVTDLVEAFGVDFPESELPLMKDPRLCRLLHLWKDIFAQQGRPVFSVIPYRNPIDVVASLVARDKLDPYLANLLYLRNLLDAEIASRDLPRVFVAYQDIVTDPVSALDRVRSASPFVWPNDLDRAADAIRSATRDDLRHHKAPIASLANRSATPAWVHGVYECYRALEKDSACVAALKELDRIRLALDQVSHSVTPLDRKIDWNGFSGATSDTAHSRLLTFRIEEQQADIASSPGGLDIRSVNALKGVTDSGPPIEDTGRQSVRIEYLHAALDHATNAVRQKDSLIDRLEKQAATLEQRTALLGEQITSEASINSRLKADLADSLASTAALRLAMTELKIERDRLGNEGPLAQKELQVVQNELREAREEQSAARREVELVRASFLNSTSWRVSKPLRVVKRIFTRRGEP